MQQPSRDPLAVLASVLGLALLAWMALRPPAPAAEVSSPDLSVIEAGLDRLSVALEKGLGSSGIQAVPATAGTQGPSGDPSPRQAIPDTAALRREIAALRAQVLALSRGASPAPAEARHLLPTQGQRVQRLSRINQTLHGVDSAKRELLRQELLLLSETQVLAQLGKPSRINVNKYGYETWTYKFKNAQAQDKSLSLRITGGRVIYAY